jgi:hypothetical protein
LDSGRTLTAKVVIGAPGPVGNVDVKLDFQVKLQATNGVLHVDMTNTNAFSKLLVGTFLKVGSFKLGYTVTAQGDGLAVKGDSTIRLEMEDHLGPRFVRLIGPIFEFIKASAASAQSGG